MNFKTAIMIPVFEYTEEEFEQSRLNLGDPSKMGFNQAQERAFWTIDSAYAYGENTNYGAFFSSGNSFVSPWTKEKLITTINNHKNE